MEAALNFSLTFLSREKEGKMTQPQMPAHAQVRVGMTWLLVLADKWHVC